MSAAAPDRAGDDADICARTLRDLDHDRFIANLFAPQPARRRLNALFAFAGELAAVPARVHEPMLGQMRLQWWREAVDGLARGARTGHPVADELGHAVAASRLEGARLTAMVDARERELSGVPMASLAELERHFGATVAAPLACACRVLGGEADGAACHAGIALGLAALLTAEGRSRNATLLPADLMGVHGLSAEVVIAGDRRAAAFTGDLVANARDRLGRARDALAAAPEAVLPAFLPLVVAAGDLDRLAAQPLRDEAPLPRWRRQLAMWRAARRGRI